MIDEGIGRSTSVANNPIPVMPKLVAFLSYADSQRSPGNSPMTMKGMIGMSKAKVISSNKR